MKILELFFFIVFFFSCTSTNSNNSKVINQEKETELTLKDKSTIENNTSFNSVKSLTIYKVEIDILTIITVNCENFQDYFQDNISKKEERDNVFINRFKEKISKLKKENYPDGIDTRYQIVLNYKDGKKELICGDRFNIYFRNEYYNVDNSFLSLFYEKEDL